MRVIDLTLFVVPAAIQAILLTILIRRKLYRRGMFPLFSGYTAYSVLLVTPRAIMATRPAQYPTFYWSTEIVYGVLALLSLNEVFTRTFFLDYEERPYLRAAFPLTVVLIMAGLFAWWRFIHQTPTGGHFGAFASIFVAFNQGVHSIEGILLVLFMILWVVLAPGWNRYDYGILLGFGLSGLVTMTADMIRFNSPLPHGYQIWYRYAPGTVYTFVAAIWLYAFWPRPDPLPKAPMRFQALVQRVNRNNEVMRVVHRWLHRGRSGKDNHSRRKD